MTRALVLSGGGSKGAFQVGVLKRWMGDLGLDYDVLCGVSVGAINVAGLALTPKGNPTLAAQKLEEFWLSKVTGTSAIYKRWFPFGRLHGLWKGSLYDSSPLVKLIKENLKGVDVASCDRRLAVGAVCLDTGEYEFGTEADADFPDWVAASASYPVFFTPVVVKGKLYSDGGIVNVTPLGRAISMGADEIDVVMCSDPFSRDPWVTSKKSAVPHQMIRTLSLMSNEVSRSDIEEVGLKNSLADIGADYKKVSIRVVVPSTPLEVDSLSFDKGNVKRMIEQGYRDADSFVGYV